MKTVFLTLFWGLISVYPSFAIEENLSTSVLINESFDKVEQKNVLETSAKNRIIKSVGSEVETVKRNSFLNIGFFGWVEYLAPSSLSTSEGTISVWIKPKWKTTDTESHTIFSMRWADPEMGYLALSQGWWEPEGAGRLYFILNNQEYIHCSVPIRLVTGFWTNVTLTWHNGLNGHCRLYIDGKKVAENTKSYFSSHRPEGPLFIGSDMGATDSVGRRGEFLIDNLIIFNRSQGDTEIKQLYLSQLQELEEVEKKGFLWLSEGLNLPLIRERSKDGTLIETRVIFDEDILWSTSRKATDEILSRVKRAGFNVYVPCVWHGKGTYFPTSIAIADSRVKHRIESGDDPLAYLIATAHALGVEVHPWFTVVKRSSEDYPQFYDSGTPSNAFNVHNIDFRRFIVELMVDMVRRYDVDGVNLDYIRTLGICDSKFCREDYKNQQGHQFWSDFALRAVNGSARNRIQEWQDAAVGQIVEDFSTSAKKLKPYLVVSVDGHPKPKKTRRPLDGRDVIQWLENGWVDIIFAMDYRERIDFETIDAVRSELDDASKLIPLLGNYEKFGTEVLSRSGELVAKYAEFSVHRWPQSGIAFYLYGWLSDKQVESLGEGVFSEAAVPRWSRFHRKIIH